MDVKALCREDAEPYGETQRVPAYRQEAYGRCSLCFTGGMGTFHAACHPHKLSGPMVM